MLYPHLLPQGQRASLSHKYQNLHRESVSLLETYHEEPEHPQIFTCIHVMSVTHSHAALSLCVLFLPRQPEIFSDFRNIPSSPHYLTMPSSLPRHSITWSPEQDDNIHSLASTEQVPAIVFCVAGTKTDQLIMLAPKTNFLQGWLQSRSKGTISSC